MAWDTDSYILFVRLLIHKERTKKDPYPLTELNDVSLN